MDRYIGKNHVFFFFDPKYFTFICPSELHAFQSKLAGFEARGTNVIRMVDALQLNVENGEVYPANWQKGEEGMTTRFDGAADYLATH